MARTLFFAALLLGYMVDVTRERISRNLELREMPLSFQAGFSFVSARVILSGATTALICTPVSGCLQFYFFKFS